ncbi:MAG: hypothetical protein QOJ72_1937 [Nocardioidaceae bacterium]|jgi:hypothetical protein|nr:hypothetical protein [Nocardioidaceae bacterium]
MMILLAAILVLASGIALVRAIPHDGYGTRPAPRSHIDPFDPRHLV